MKVGAKDREDEPAAEAFWKGLEEGRLLLQSCAECGHLQYPPMPVCAVCAGIEFEWVEASGRARVLSWITTHHAFHPSWATRTPYTTVLVELAERPDLAMYGAIASDEGLADGAEVSATIDGSGDEPVVAEAARDAPLPHRAHRPAHPRAPREP